MLQIAIKLRAQILGDHRMDLCDAHSIREGTFYTFAESQLGFPSDPTPQLPGTLEHNFTQIRVGRVCRPVRWRPN